MRIILTILLVTISFGFVQAANPVALTPDGQMYLMNGDEDGDTAEVRITGNGEDCTVYINSVGNVVQTDCQRLINSKKIKILCTGTKKICKTENEIYGALKGEIKGEHIRMPGLYQVTAQELNVRNKPQKPSTILGTLKQGDKIVVHEFHDKWGRTDYGWVSGKYLKLLEPKEPKVNSIHFTKNTVHISDDYSDMKAPAIYEVDIGELNVRDQPQKPSNILRTVKRGDRVTIYAFVGKWGRTDNGWVSGKYLKYIAPAERSVSETYSNTHQAPQSETKESNEESSYSLFEIIGVLILLGLFFRYWKIVLGIAVLIGIGQAILEHMGIDPTNFLIGTGILFVLVMGLIVYFSCSGEKCPNCNTCVKNYAEKNLVEQHYQHETKTGKPDLRYKDNPVISTYRYTYICPNEECQTKFTIDREQVDYV